MLKIRALDHFNRLSYASSSSLVATPSNYKLSLSLITHADVVTALASGVIGIGVVGERGDVIEAWEPSALP